MAQIAMNVDTQPAEATDAEWVALRAVVEENLVAVKLIVQQIVRSSNRSRRQVPCPMLATTHQPAQPSP